MQRKGPLPGKIFARCILQRRFAGLFGYMARISCQSQLISDAWRANLARKGRFSHPRPPFGMHGAQNLPRIAARERISRAFCHRRAPGNAQRRNLATAKRSGTHRARTLSPSDAGGTHFAGILPSASARERIRAQSCHRQTPGNTSMKNLHNRHLTIVYKSLTRNQAEYNKEIGF